MHVEDDDLVLHYYGELGAADEARVAAHVGECRDCHAAFRRLQQVLMSVDESALAPPELPDGLRARGLGAAAAGAAAANARGWLSRLVSRPNLGWAAAALAIAIGSFYAGHRWPGAARVVAAGRTVRRRPPASCASGCCWSTSAITSIARSACSSSW